MAIRVRALTSEEREAIARLSQARTEAACLVERAKIVWLSSKGQRVKTIAQALGLHPQTVRDRLKRFNAEGLAGLQDKPRPGRPATYSAEEVGAVIAAALSDPQELGLAFASWTLDRLEVYLNETQGIAIKRSRIDEILIAEGLRWRKEETWFGARVDPQFAEKRGSSPSSTRSPRSTA